MPKLSEVNLMLIDNNFDILGLCELFFYLIMYVTMKLLLDRYHMIRKDRLHTQGGGKLVYIKDKKPLSEDLILRMLILNSLLTCETIYCTICV